MQKKNDKREKSALVLALKQLRLIKRDNWIESALLFTCICSVSLLLIFISSSFVYNGYATYISSQAGYITGLEVTAHLPVYYWHGLHGLALRVPGYLQQIYEDINPSEISSTGLFFDCMQSDAIGGKEIYASTSNVINFENLQPADPVDVDLYTGCSGIKECAINTFTETMWVMSGSRNITNIPATYTYKWDGSSDVFDIGVLTDGTNLVYVSHVSDLQTGYSVNSTVNFQMLLPTRFETTERYYFFADPYDECPEGGGIGETIKAKLDGMILDSLGNIIEGAKIIFTGEVGTSDSLGFYNVSATVNPGIYNVIVQADGYDDYTFNVSVNFTDYEFERNVTLSKYTPGFNDTILPIVTGYVTSSNGGALIGVTVSLGDSTTLTNVLGYYSLNPVLTAGVNPIVAYKSGYNNYYSLINFSNVSVSHNFSMVPTNDNEFETGPYDENNDGVEERIIEEIETTGEDYWVSTKEIYKEIRQNTFLKESISVFNFRDTTMNLVFELSDGLEGVVTLGNNVLSVAPNSLGEMDLTFYGTKPLGDYNGTIKISGDINQVIPTTVKIVEKRQTVETLLINIGLMKGVVQPGDTLKYKVSLSNLLRGHSYEVFLENSLVDFNDSYSLDLGDDKVEVKNSLSYLDEVKIPENLSDGSYKIKIDATYLNYKNSVVASFDVRTPIYLYAFFGVPVWVFLTVIAVLSFLFLIYFLYRKEKEKKKRYKASLDFNALPKKEDRSLTLGKIAESKVPAYLQLDNLATHCIVAGATGGGKSISAQVIVEEALLKNTAVVVFDPTAQWSGMLRKCDDKHMLSFYPKFGLKPTDAKAFPGNIRMVDDARQIIDLNKYLAPGHIQIFALNKLDPKDIDVFVANMIRQIFRSDPKEAPQLNTLLIFDEVHRLLPKFGGSGEGFLQIERACREFRKWGMGVMLISQVLSDFVGEVKANINTEVQMRTIEESDLNRIKTKYGDIFLKSLVKSEVGVGMIQNAEYNNGKPYFVNFRPILHNTRRLSDEELIKYNEYNIQAEDIEFEIEELEKLKIDVFDLKMELKLVKDKIMTGNFSVVDIYLQGLKPRLEKQWQKLGKKAPKRKIQLADMNEIKKAVEEAKKEREKAEKAEEGKK